MTPPEPTSPLPSTPRPAAAPPYVDENPELALVEQGMELAEDEARAAVADGYQSAALQGDDPEGALDDIDFSGSEERQEAPELAAMHEEWIPSADSRYRSP